MKSLRCRQQDAFKRYEEEMKKYKADVKQYETDLADWKRAKAKDRGARPEEPQEPVASRYCCDDTTIEALAMLLKQNWRGLLMVRDELAGWLQGFDRYAQGKGGEVAKWLEMHGGRPVTVDRKTGTPKTIYIPRAAVSIAGGIQPSTLKRALGREYFDNGLAARLLMAWPPRRAKKWTEAEVDPMTETAVAVMFDRLYSLEPIIGEDDEPRPCVVRLSAAAKKAWVKFYVAAGVALSRWFDQETLRIYAMLGENDDDRDRRLLVEWIQRRGGSTTVRELSHFNRAYRQTEMAEQALNGLVQAGAR